MLDGYITHCYLEPDPNSTEPMFRQTKDGITPYLDHMAIIPREKFEMLRDFYEASLTKTEPKEMVDTDSAFEYAMALLR